MTHHHRHRQLAVGSAGRPGAEGGPVDHLLGAAVEVRLSSRSRSKSPAPAKTGSSPVWADTGARSLGEPTDPALKLKWGGSVQGTRLAASRAGLGQRTSVTQPSCSSQRMIRALESS